MTSDLAPGLRMIIHPPEVITIGHRSESAVQGQNLQPMSRKIKLTNDLGPQQRNHIGTNGELEPGKNFVSDSGSTQHMTALEHQHLLTRTREIGSVHQSVVATADNDDVVFAHSILSGPLKLSGHIANSRLT